MSKIRADWIWHQLTPEQHKTMMDWLFVANLSFQETHERVKREFGLECSLSSVARYHRRAEMERAREQFEDDLAAAEKVNDLGGQVGQLRASSLKLIGIRFLGETMRGGDAKELAALGKLLLESQEREIQQGRLDLARARFEFRAAQAAIKVAPMLDEMSQEDMAREMERINAAQKRLFGEPPDGMG